MNFYEIIKTKKLGRGFPDYWTQLFAEHVGGKGEWTIAGVLPLTFTAKGGNAVDWMIEGNDDVGENLFDINDLEQGAIDPATGQNTDVTGFKRTTNYISLDVGGNYYMTAPNGGIRIFQYTSDKSFVSSYLHTQAKSLELGANIKYIRMAAIADSYPNNLMLVKGSTAPDHYIPYQQGVGERTENLFDINNVLENYYLDKGIPTRFYSGGYVLSDYIPIASNTVTISAKITKESNFGAHLEVYDENKTFIRGGVALLAHGEGIIKKVVDASGAAFLRVDYALESLIDCMLNLGSTALPYKPYGYQIPLTISQAGQPDKMYDIYIGDSPLTEGETVSKTSTGVDIELFEGENVVSTILYNKPNMKIKYK